MSECILKLDPRRRSSERALAQIEGFGRHVLRRHDNRLAVRRMQDVVGRHHQHGGFELGFQRERYVDRHLVAVEVGVEGGASPRATGPSG
jgi:hypothetical protein